MRKLFFWLFINSWIFVAVNLMILKKLSIVRGVTFIEITLYGLFKSHMVDEQVKLSNVSSLARSKGFKCVVPPSLQLMIREHTVQSKRSKLFLFLALTSVNVSFPMTSQWDCSTTWSRIGWLTWSVVYKFIQLDMGSETVLPRDEHQKENPKLQNYRSMTLPIVENSDENEDFYL